MEPQMSDDWFGWFNLVDRKDQYGHQSKSNNPQCKVSTYGCSDAMKGDVCFWHHYRMGCVKTFYCGCPGKSWKTAVGDADGRRLVRLYYPNETFCLLDSFNRLCCCSNSCSGDGDDNYKCGEMILCNECKDKHPRCVGINDSDSDSDSDDDIHRDHNDWIHLDDYKHAINERITNGEQIMHCQLTVTGPMFRIQDPITGSHVVNSASAALVAAGRNPRDASCRIWIAGWFDDCPDGIKKHY